MQVINTQAPVVNLESARKAVVNVAGKTGEVIKNYAAAMCQAFNLVDNAGNITTPWYELKGKLKSGVNDERTLFVTAMQSAGFEKPTIDVYWQRVKEASGRVKANNKVTSKPDVDAENIKALKAILNRIDTTEPENAPMSFKVVKLLVRAADLMDIDVSAYAIGRDDE